MQNYIYSSPEPKNKRVSENNESQQQFSQKLNSDISNLQNKDNSEAQFSNNNTLELSYQAPQNLTPFTKFCHELSPLPEKVSPRECSSSRINLNQLREFKTPSPYFQKIRNNNEFPQLSISLLSHKVIRELDFSDDKNNNYNSPHANVKQTYHSPNFHFPNGQSRNEIVNLNRDSSLRDELLKTKMMNEGILNNNNMINNNIAQGNNLMGDDGRMSLDKDNVGSHLQNINGMNLFKISLNQGQTGGEGINQFSYANTTTENEKKKSQKTQKIKKSQLAQINASNTANILHQIQNLPNYQNNSQNSVHSQENNNSVSQQIYNQFPIFEDKSLIKKHTSTIKKNFSENTPIQNQQNLNQQPFQNLQTNKKQIANLFTPKQNVEKDLELEQKTITQTKKNPEVDSVTKKFKITCNCKKSRCLKLYCECFANKQYCKDCNCVNCANTPDNEDQRQAAMQNLLDRNPQAFEKKVNEEVQEEGKHIKGCNCKKSGCVKKYCECYQARVRCTNLCKCEGCKNTHLHTHNYSADNSGEGDYSSENIIPQNQVKSYQMAIEMNEQQSIKNTPSNQQIITFNKNHFQTPLSNTRKKIKLDDFSNQGTEYDNNNAYGQPKIDSENNQNEYNNISQNLINISNFNNDEEKGVKNNTISNKVFEDNNFNQFTKHNCIEENQENQNQIYLLQQKMNFINQNQFQEINQNNIFPSNDSPSNSQQKYNIQQQILNQSNHDQKSSLDLEDEKKRSSKRPKKVKIY